MENLLDGAINPENYFQSREKHKTYGSSLYGITKEKYFTNLKIFYHEMTDLVEEGRAMEIVYLDFSEAFSTVS